MIFLNATALTMPIPLLDAGIGDPFLEKRWLSQADFLGHGTGHTKRHPFLSLARGIIPMNVEAMNAALGLSFAIIWMVVGQIVVTNR